MSPVNNHNFGSVNSLGPLPTQSSIGGNGGGNQQHNNHQDHYQQRDFSMFSVQDNNPMDFDFLGSYRSGQILEDNASDFGNNFHTGGGNHQSGVNGSANIFNSGSNVMGNRLDREYLWEGDEMMFEDIIASTHPLNYNPALYSRKFDYDSHFFGN